MVGGQVRCAFGERLSCKPPAYVPLVPHGRVSTARGRHGGREVGRPPGWLSPPPLPLALLGAPWRRRLWRLSSSARPSSAPVPPTPRRRRVSRCPQKPLVSPPYWSRPCVRRFLHDIGGRVCTQAAAAGYDGRGRPHPVLLIRLARPARLGLLRHWFSIQTAFGGAYEWCMVVLSEEGSQKLAGVLSWTRDVGGGENGFTANAFEQSPT